MTVRGGLFFILMMSLAATGSAKDLAPSAYGAAPPCSKEQGLREFHSAVVQEGDVNAYLAGLARRDATGCHRSVELRIDRGAAETSVPLPSDADNFEIVDFSPNGSRLFLASEKADAVSIGVMPIATADLRWRDISDIFGWDECDALVEPLGWTASGELAVRAQHSVLSPPRRPNCVQDEQVYAIDPRWKPRALTGDAANIAHVGKQTHPAAQQCRTDPDLIDECFHLNGRLTAYNGDPTYRIWRVGTHRLLGVTDRPFPQDMVVLPEPLASKMKWGLEAWGDFLVCPFTGDEPGTMQKVCIESADDVTFKRREGDKVAAKPAD